MDTAKMKLVEEYYNTFATKDLNGIKKYLHPDLKFVGPMAESKGVDAYLEASKHFFGFFQKLTIRTVCGSKEGVMLAYDFDCPDPVGFCRGAAYVSFTGDLISRIELFYDARPFEQYQKEIFAESAS